MNLQTNKSEDGRELTISLPERFGFELHGDFRDAYRNETELNLLVLDMNKTSYMDSSALGMMLQLKEYAEHNDSAIIVKNAKGSIRQIMQIAHFDKMFNIE